VSVDNALKQKDYSHLTVEMYCAVDKWRCHVRGNQHSNITGSSAVPYILDECRPVLCSAFSTVHAVGLYVIVSCPFDIKLTGFNLRTNVFVDDS
jgi:hypothetical protein